MLNQKVIPLLIRKFFSLFHQLFKYGLKTPSKNCKMMPKQIKNVICDYVLSKTFSLSWMKLPGVLAPLPLVLTDLTEGGRLRGPITSVAFADDSDVDVDREIPDDLHLPTAESFGVSGVSTERDEECMLSSLTVSRTLSRPAISR